MMNCTSSRTIKPIADFTYIFKYWNRERYITVVVVSTTVNSVKIITSQSETTTKTTTKN